MSNNIIFTTFLILTFFMLGQSLLDEKDLQTYTSWNKDQDDCATELNLNKTKIQELKKTIVVPEDDDDLNSYLLCYWKKRNFIEEDSISYTNLKKVSVEEYSLLVHGNPNINEIIMGGMIRSALETCENENIEQENLKLLVIKTQNCIGNNLELSLQELKNNTVIS